MRRAVTRRLVLAIAGEASRTTDWPEALAHALRLAAGYGATSRVSGASFGIALGGKRYWLELRGGEWRLDGRWVATNRIDWPEALARALWLAAG